MESAISIATEGLKVYTILFRSFANDVSLLFSSIANYIVKYPWSFQYNIISYSNLITSLSKNAFELATTKLYLQDLLSRIGQNALAVFNSDWWLDMSSFAFICIVVLLIIFNQNSSSSSSLIDRYMFCTSVGRSDVHAINNPLDNIAPKGKDILQDSGDTKKFQVGSFFTYLSSSTSK